MAGEEETVAIENFNPEEFANNLADQARDFVPQEFPQEEKDFIVNYVRNFCLMSGDALSKDMSVNLDADQASFITQIIGEWTFHKSVDLIRGGIDINLREEILKKVAFTVFEVCKTAIVNKMPPDKVLLLVEEHVGKSYREALKELNKKGVLDNKEVDCALKQSNIDQMAQEEVKKEIPHAGMSDSKILKLASLAFLIKHFSKDKIASILSGFDKDESSVLLQYINMDNLEEKLNPDIAARCLSDMKHYLPEPKKISFERCYIDLTKIIKKFGKDKINYTIENERGNIKEYVNSAIGGKAHFIPSMVANCINEYLKEKLA